MNYQDRHEACEHVWDAASYLLGALDDPQAYEQHLESCSTCRAELAELRPVVTGLAGTVPQARAPTEMRRRLVARVTAEAELLNAAGPEADKPPRWPWLRPRRLLALATAWSVALALVVAAIVGGTEHSHARIQYAEVAPGLAGTQASLRELDGHAELTVHRMPQAPLGKTYEVWLLRGASPPQATDALFTVTNRGTGSVNIPDRLTHVDEVMVTAEPLGGSTQPTGSPLLRFHLHAVG